MEAWLIFLTRQAAFVIDGMALIVIAFGTLEAFVQIAIFTVRPPTPDSNKRAVWLRLARSLVAGLTFLLAADIVETSIAPTWDEIGRLAAIAAIRTFLNFFLDRDVEEIRERDECPGAPPTM